jgi:hypothetical protein
VEKKNFRKKSFSPDMAQLLVLIQGRQGDSNPNQFSSKVTMAV